MKSGAALEKYIVLYIPWALSLMLSGSPIASYFIAWLGSFFIFALTLTGTIKPLPDDRPIAAQLMRPIFIVQIIFAGYMCCTSIFYFFSVLGYENFVKIYTAVTVDPDVLERTAQCQRYYCLGHAAFVTGILSFMTYPVRSKFYIEQDKLANLLLQMAIILFPVSILFLMLPGLSQFYYQLSALSFIAGTLALAFAIPLRKFANTVICIALYVSNLREAFVSGFKEPIIISVLVLGLFLYPNYKKMVTIIFLPVLILMFVFLPAYVASFRKTAWSGDETAEVASKEAADAAFAQKDADDESNWDFLIFRLSEIEMFTRYIKSTPSYVPYYGFTLIEQSGMAIIPRFFWPTKPLTESLIMERVYSAGVVNRGSNVSAKPAYIVDTYLAYGPIGIFIGLFLYGAAAQAISIKAEKLFGGYIFGTALVFSGLFQTFWRGLSLEFIVNTVFWSYITMLLLFRILRNRNILKPI